MQSTQADKLVMMANQIGKFFASQPRVKVPEAIAEHLRKFWDPRMIREIEAYLQGGGAGLDRDARAAVQLLAAQDAAAQ
jgi:formate dehydrogenase subunit delta